MAVIAIKLNTASRFTIQSLDRGLLLLGQVVNSDKPLKLKELADFLEIEKSSVHRLMATLKTHGLVAQDARKAYLPGPAIMELASKMRNRLNIHDLAGGCLAELAQRTGETAHLAILADGQSVLTNSVSSNHALAVNSRVGQSEPLHCTALGKALLCGYDREKIKALFRGRRLKRFTSKTITSVNTFINECSQVHKTLIARDDQEYRCGVRCVATPVLDLTGDVVGAIGISGPADRLDKNLYEKSARIVKSAGVELSEKLGFMAADRNKNEGCIR